MEEIPAPAEETYSALAMRLLGKGWNPIPVEGKLPVLDGPRPLRWKAYQRRQPYLFEVMNWQRRFPLAGVAIALCADCFALDIDEDEPSKAARLGDIAEQILGPSPINRVGRWPRQVRLYRGRGIRPRDIGSVQVLSRGHYVVMYGTHPGTRRPYSHYGRHLYEIRPAELPIISARSFQEFSAALAEVFGEKAPGAISRARTPARVGTTGLTFAQAIAGVGQGYRHKALWHIACAYRGNGAPFQEACEAVRQAARRCLPPVADKEAADVVKWCYAKLRPGRARTASSPQGACRDLEQAPAVLRVAYQRAIDNPIPGCRGTLRYRVLVGIAYDLHTYLRAAFALPQPDLGKLLDCSHVAVGQMIHKAMREGWFVPADPHYRIGSRAKTYLWRGNNAGMDGYELASTDDVLPAVA